MKRIISFVLIFMLILPFAACTRPGNNDASVTEVPASQPAQTAAPVEGETEEPVVTPEPEITPEPAAEPTPMPETPAERDDLPMVYAGKDVFFVLYPDGNLYGWGRNDHGQLGRGGTEDSSVPVHIAIGLKPVIVGETVFALSSDNVLWGWGRNDKGQLGTGDTADRLRPEELMYSVVQVTKGRGGEYYALTESGELYTWGVSGYSGDADAKQTGSALSPALLFENVTYFDQDYIIMDEGNLWQRWGEEWRLVTSGVRNVWHDYDTAAIEAKDGFLYAVGAADSRAEEPGLRLITESFRSVTVSDGVIWVLTDDGSLYSYKAGYSTIIPIDGEDGFGELTFVMDGVVKFETGTYMDEDWGYDYKLALKANGELWAWGEYTEPALGKPQMSASETPECVAHGVRSFVTTGAQTYIIADDGGVWASGWAGEGFVFGGLGDGTDSTKYGFVYLGIEGFCTVTSRMDEEFIDYDDGTDGVRLYCRTFAVDAEGRIFAWGWNGDGLLGTGGAEELVLTPAEIHCAK